MPRRVFNIARTLALFLVLGAIVNIAVAWGLQSVFGSRYTSPDLAYRYRGWEIWHFTGFGFTEAGLVIGGNEQYVRSLPERLPPYWSRLQRVEPYRRIDPVLLLSDLAYGWPLRSLWYEFDAERSWTRPGILSQHVAGCLSVGNLAMRPIWLGFALNTLFYAAILFTLIRGRLVARRALRRRHGLCVACGYDLRGHGHHHGNGAATCPECGMA